MICASFAEVVSLGAVLPFLGVLTTPDRVYNHPSLHPIFSAAGLNSPAQLLIPLTLSFIAAAIAAGALRLVLLYVTTRLSFATGADLASNIYRRTLYQPYLIHLARNSSEVIKGIDGKTHEVCFHTLMPVLTLISSALIFITILVTLVAIDPVVATSTMLGFGVIYGLIVLLTRRKLAENSERISRESVQVVKSLQEGLGAIRDILLDGSQDTYCKIYQKSDISLRNALGNNLFIAGSPRFIMEALGMALIAAIAYSLAHQSDGIAKAIPVLGALALGAQRLMPILQQAYVAVTNISGSYASLNDVLELMEQPLPRDAGLPTPAPLRFERSIRLDRISFRYTPAAWVLEGLTLEIPRGSRIGIIGTTGSGKSTLLDIIMGLIEPHEGALLVDGIAVTEENRRAWQLHVAHVPQVIYLADSTIEENIAFGLPDEQIDHERVRQAAKRAQVADIIESWPDGYRTIVGERGVRLSGGQRQRIGIARALYKQADVIVFDEATSALDNETERAVMESIEALSADLTIIIVAHRLTTLQGCDRIIELVRGRLSRVGTYDELITGNFCEA